MKTLIILATLALSSLASANDLDLSLLGSQTKYTCIVEIGRRSISQTCDTQVGKQKITDIPIESSPSIVHLQVIEEMRPDFTLVTSNREGSVRTLVFQKR